MKKNEKSGWIKERLRIGFFVILLLAVIVKNDQGAVRAASNGYGMDGEYEPVIWPSKNQDLNMVKSLQRDGGMDFGGLILASEPVGYYIQIAEYDNSNIVDATASGNKAKEYENYSDGAAVSLNEFAPGENPGEILENETDEEADVLSYKVGGIEGTLPIQDGYAQLIIEEDTSALLQVWYTAEGTVYPVIEEYLLIDKSKPEIICEQIEENDKQYARIVITDQGEGASGLKGCTFIVDGENCEPDEINTLKTVAWPNGEIVPVQQEIDIPLEGDALHEIEVQALDNAGNSTADFFQMKAVPEDVINVFSPVSFSIAIRPLEDKENWQIYGEDVVVSNQSYFPVGATLARAEVYVNHLMPDSGVNDTDSGNAGKAEDELQAEEDCAKDCEIYLQLRQTGCETVIIPLNEGINENILDIVLAAKQEGDSSPEADGLNSNLLDAADDSSCAVLNICGNLSDGSEMLWQDGDLKVTLTFKYCKSS